MYRQIKIGKQVVVFSKKARLIFQERTHLANGTREFKLMRFLSYFTDKGTYYSKVHYVAGSHAKQAQGKLKVLINKLTSVFHASVLLLIMNFVITLSK